MAYNLSCSSNKMMDFIAQSKVMLELKESLKRIPSKKSVLIHGLTGSGKEVVANNIHYLSNRANESFVIVNCARFKRDHAESELMGTKYGAFTGSVDRIGLIKVSNGGTLMLDELSAMSLDTQVELLRVVEDGVVTQLGSNRGEKVDFRIIATLRDTPEVCIKNGLLYDHLFYRLNDYPVEVPSLTDKQRIEDIVPLAQHFLKLYTSSKGPKKEFSKETLNKLPGYYWSGNVRQLKKAVEYSFDMSLEGEITPKYIERYLGGDVKLQINLNEKALPSLQDLIKAHLINNNYDSAKTAIGLNISERSLIGFIREYDIHLSK